MQTTKAVLEVLGAMYEHSDKFYYVHDIMDALGTPGKAANRRIRRVLTRLLDNGLVVHLVNNAERPKGVRKNQKCYRIGKEGKKLVLKHKLTYFRAYKTRKYVMYPKRY